ncbi:threonine/serine exporter family protein [Pseudactinotalea suaedae]
MSVQAERDVLDVVLRTGEALLGTGAGVADVTVAMQRMAAGLGMSGCQIDITFNSITISLDREDGALTRVRVLEVRTSDYSRLAEVLELVDDVAAGHVALTDAIARLDAIVAAPHPYRRWVVTAALGLMAAGVAVLLGGGWQVAGLAALTTGVIDRALRFLRHRGLPYLFQQAVGSAIATAVAVVLLWGVGRMGWDIAVLPPSLVVASGIVVLLAGLSLVGAAQDAISGFPLTAAGRSFEVALLTLGIVIGVGVVLDVGARMGVPLSISDLDAFAPPLAVQIAGAAVVSGSFAVASYTRMRTVPLVALIGGVGTAVNGTLAAVGVGPAARAFAAALVVGVLAGVLARRRTAPAMVLTVCGITPMLPGLAIYGAMYAIVESGSTLSGATLTLQAVAVGIALAAGVSLGDFVARTTRAQADRWQTALHRRARGTRI